MSSIIISSFDVLRSLDLKVQRKSQKEDACYNYFFTPTMSIRLYKPMISVVNKDYIVFKMKRYENSSVHSFLEGVSENLYTVLGSYYNTNGLSKDSILLVNDDYIYLKAHLPQRNYKYHITIHNGDTNQLSQNFSLPRQQAIYDEVVIDIRNIWQYKERLGYRLELKHVSF